MAQTDPRYSDVGSDEAIMLYSQYSTHWDGLAHKGTLFDADGDGVVEKVSYNGFALVDGAGRGLYATPTASLITRSRPNALCSTAMTGVCANGSLIPVWPQSRPTILPWSVHPHWAPIRDWVITDRSCRCMSTAWSSWGYTSGSYGT